ncbi:MAG: Na(+)-translocating NADH-quinone reductase subunit C, partial [Pseudomonadota bacterium]
MPDETMTSANSSAPKGIIRQFLDMPPDAPIKTVVFAVTLCLVASMAVAALAVSLRPIQEVNKLQNKQTNILQVAGIYQEGSNVAEAFEAFEPRVLELDTGKFTDEFDAASFDDR